MKRLSLLMLCLLLMTPILRAQNVQLHYDFGHSMYDELDTRPKITTTVEMFKPDRWGSTFFFVDMDYADGAVSSAYWEIARELSFWKSPWSLHIEYNGGLNFIKNSYLAGATYSWNNGNFTRGYTLSALYKHLQDHDSPHSFQLTGTWYMHFCEGKYSFTGFADFWGEEHTDIKGNQHDYCFIAEPQFWVNLNRFSAFADDLNLSVGTEWEISHNFAVNDGWYCNPTIALKWTF